MKNIFNKSSIFVFVSIGLFPLLWFVKYRTALIDGLDTNFPLDPTVWFVRRLYIWNDVLNGGLHFSSSVAGLFFHFLQVLPYSLGASLQAVEILNILFWSISIILAAYFFSKTFISKRFIVQLFFVSLYSFNIYLFNSWENIKVANLSLMVGLPLVLSLMKLTTERKISWKRTVLYSSIVGVTSAGTGINPAYFICLLFGAFLYLLILLATKQNKKDIIRFSLSVLVPFGAVNAFWIIPLIDYLFITNTVQNLESIGFTNWVASLSANTSLLNVIRLQGAWDWYIRNDYGVPLYIPYASRYFYSVPFIVFSFVIPLLAFASFTFRKSEKSSQYLFFLALSILGVFLGAGLHEPTGVVFNFLLNHLPFFSFFRSPWYIFTPYTIIGLGGLASLFIETLFERFSSVRFYKLFTINIILSLLTLSLVVAQMVYSYPLITGKIFRPGRDDSFYQTFPDYVFDTKTMLLKSPYSRIVTYPDDQLESFKWGYKGTESILGLFANIEVIAPSFNYPNQYLAALIERFYSNLKRGEFLSAFELSHILGVDSMFIKTDTISLAPDILDNVSSFTSEAVSIKDWHFMMINNQYSSQKFQIPKYIYALDMTPNRISDVARFISKDSVIVSQNDSQLENLPEMKSKIASIIEAKPSSTQNIGNIEFTYSTNWIGQYTIYLAGYKVKATDLTVVLDNTVIPNNQLTEDENAVSINLTSNAIGEHTLLIKLPQVKKEVLQALELPVIGTPQEGTTKTLLFKNFDPFKKYEVSFDYQFVNGELPSFQIAQSGPRSPYKIEPIKLIKNEDWLTQKFIFSPVELASKLEFIIQQPQQKDFTSKSFFRNIEISEIQSYKAYVIQKASPLIDDNTHLTHHKDNPTQYQLKVENAPDGYFIEMKEGYHRGWTIDSKDYIGGKPVHMTANGYANLWYVPVGGNATIVVSFLGQKLYMVGLFISAIVLLTSLAIFIYDYKKNK
jgi:hypothetical protein